MCPSFRPTKRAGWLSAPLTRNGAPKPPRDRADTTKLDEARNELEKQIRDLTREDQHDRVWAEVQESLGDFSWTRRNYNNWGEAWPHYQAALDWWAGAADIELARERYLEDRLAHGQAARHAARLLLWLLGQLRSARCSR